MKKVNKKNTSTSKKQINATQKKKNPLFSLGILVAFFIVCILYLCTSASKTNAVIIEGNHYLSDSYIQEISGIKQGDVFFFNIPFIKELQLKSDPMIESATVSWSNQKTMKINVTEKKAIGYRYEDDTAYILLSDNTKAELKSDYLDIIASVPLITGFEDVEQTRLLCKAFSDVDQSTIESISEISQYATSYDAQAMKILMRNGSYFLGNYQNLDKLNQYYSIYSAMQDKSMCISADENSNVAYTMVCPWNDTSVTEYWTDAEGNIIENIYGDKVVKNYYTDSEGNTALDANGNPIPIPIDDNGTELIDENFNTNYANGYYSTGSLVLPEGYDNTVTEPEETVEPETDEYDMTE